MTGTQSPMTATEQRFAWLNDRADGWQFGETGILEALSERFNPDLAIEIGAGDGQTLPLTLGFLLEKGVKTLLFEADELRQNALKMTKKTAIINGFLIFDCSKALICRNHSLSSMLTGKIGRSPNKC